MICIDGQKPLCDQTWPGAEIRRASQVEKRKARGEGGWPGERYWPKERQELAGVAKYTLIGEVAKAMLLNWWRESSELTDCELLACFLVDSAQHLASKGSRAEKNVYHVQKSQPTLSLSLYIYMNICVCLAKLGFKLSFFLFPLFLQCVCVLCNSRSWQGRLPSRQPQVFA